MAVLSRRSPRTEEARRVRREATRARLTEATTELLREGATYAELAVETIAARAGISRTTFYDYFTDKRELLMAIAGDALRGAQAEANEWRPSGDVAQTKAELRALLEAFVRVYEHPAVRAIVEASFYDEQVAATWQHHHERQIKLAVRLLEAEREAGRFQEHDSPLEARARALHWLTHATILQEFALGEPADREGIIDALVDINALGVRGVLP